MIPNFCHKLHNYYKITQVLAGNNQFLKKPILVKIAQLMPKDTILGKKTQFLTQNIQFEPKTHEYCQIIPTFRQKESILDKNQRFYSRIKKLIAKSYPNLNKNYSILTKMPTSCKKKPVLAKTAK